MFIHTDFPEPVVPAINKCGIELKSPIIGTPEILFPNAIGSLWSFIKKFLSFIISLKKTFSLDWFGSSIPIVLLPGIVDILADSELVFLARNTSSESARISTIPGSSTIGIELPNQSRENVFLSEIINDKNFLIKDHKLPIALGKSISGVPIIGDLSLDLQ